MILLMFGVGLHFSIKDLLAVRLYRAARRRGADRHGDRDRLRHGACCSAGAWARAWCSDLSLSVASTVVLLRALEERNALQSSEGKIAVGWLIVEDLAMVLALVMLPALAPTLGGDASAIHAPGIAVSATPGSRCWSRWARWRCSSRWRWSSARAWCRGC